MAGEATYSQIIGPEDYNRLIGEHIFIPAADKAILGLADGLLSEVKDLGEVSVVELGCGPARIFAALSQLCTQYNVHCVGIDHDEVFLNYGRQLLSQRGHNPNRLQLADIMTYKPRLPAYLCVSQGVHHHIPKTSVNDYLQNVAEMLVPGGLYIVGDEFLPHYGASEDRRQIQAVIWYSLVIASAIADKHHDLAFEEGKTLIDDLHEGTGEAGTKRNEQVQLVLARARTISDTALSGNLAMARLFAGSLLESLGGVTGDGEGDVDPTMELSRGDFKIDHQHFAAEVAAAGFQIIGIQTFGPVLTIGGMCVYLLQKQ